MRTHNMTPLLMYAVVAAVFALLQAMSCTALPVEGAPWGTHNFPAVGLRPPLRAARVLGGGWSSRSSPEHMTVLLNLSPADIADIFTRLPISEYREVPDDAPNIVGAGYLPNQRSSEVLASQFHANDGKGGSVFGYSSGDQVRIEARSGDGRVRGSYSYRDPTGKIVKNNYWDDGAGFHVSGNSQPSALDVPEPVTETPEVAAARRSHMEAHAQAERAALLAGGDGPEMSEPVKEQDDPSQVYDEAGNRLQRYPKPHHGPLYDPSHVHDAENDAVIIENPDYESFNQVQLFYRNRPAEPHHVPEVEQDAVFLDNPQLASSFSGNPVHQNEASEHQHQHQHHAAYPPQRFQAGPEGDQGPGHGFYYDFAFRAPASLVPGELVTPFTTSDAHDTMGGSPLTYFRSSSNPRRARRIMDSDNEAVKSYPWLGSESTAKDVLVKEAHANDESYSMHQLSALLREQYEKARSLRIDAEAERIRLLLKEFDASRPAL